MKVRDRISRNRTQHHSQIKLCDRAGQSRVTLPEYGTHLFQISRDIYNKFSEVNGAFHDMIKFVKFIEHRSCKLLVTNVYIVRSYTSQLHWVNIYICRSSLSSPTNVWRRTFRPLIYTQTSARIAIKAPDVAFETGRFLYEFTVSQYVTSMDNM